MIQPQLWEWIWASSVIPAVFALSACKKSKAFDMKIFQASNIATGVLPVMLGNVDNDIVLLWISILNWMQSQQLCSNKLYFAGMSYHFWDFYEVLTGSSDDDISKWMVSQPIHHIYMIAAIIHHVQSRSLINLKFNTFQNVPTAILWYAFFFVASQLHIIEIYLSKTLIDAWTRKKTN